MRPRFLFKTSLLLNKDHILNKPYSRLCVDHLLIHVQLSCILVQCNKTYILGSWKVLSSFNLYPNEYLMSYFVLKVDVKSYLSQRKTCESILENQHVKYLIF